MHTFGSVEALAQVSLAAVVGGVVGVRHWGGHEQWRSHDKGEREGGEAAHRRACYQLLQFRYGQSGFYAGARCRRSFVSNG